MIRNSFFLFFLMVCSCNYFKPEQKSQSIARVGKSYLYKSDIAKLVPAGTSKEDSVVIVRNFIDRWASQKLMMSAAEINLSTDKQAEYNELIRQYKIDLYTKGYLEELVKTTVDTIITETELKEKIQKYKLTEKVIIIPFQENIWRFWDAVDFMTGISRH